MTALRNSLLAAGGVLAVLAIVIGFYPTDGGYEVSGRDISVPCGSPLNPIDIPSCDGATSLLPFTLVGLVAVALLVAGAWVALNPKVSTQSGE